ncbi:kinase-like domain-containing protein [Russula dissimulans]|nr:kinase-like domain-containing protein [Russula dissimulans]
MPESLTTTPGILPGTPMPSSTILQEDGAKDLPAKTESPEAAGDAGEVEKKHRCRGWECSASTHSVGPSLVPPPTSAASTSSFIVSDTALVLLSTSAPRRVVPSPQNVFFETLLHSPIASQPSLKDADDHPNVIRYYYQEAHANFLHIALELCPASLADIIEWPDQFREIAISFNPKRAVRQITFGLRRLHALKIVHRDIKLQNILISDSKEGGSSGNWMLMSHFGLCRKLEIDQTSSLPTAGGAMGVGTFGWRSPEILQGEVKLDETIADDNSQGSSDGVGTATGGNYSGVGKATTRLTKSVDIFALGCLYYYCLANGGHPFGDRFERWVNILRDHKSLEGLEGLGEGSEAVDLTGSMLAPEAADRPDTTTCLMHPYFWDPSWRLGFLQDASDRFEIMCWEPRGPHLVMLEKNAIDVVGPDWPARLDKVFVKNLGKFLLRVLRNKKHHYQDLPEHIKRHVALVPEEYHTSEPTSLSPCTFRDRKLIPAARARVSVIL